VGICGISFFFYELAGLLIHRKNGGILSFFLVTDNDRGNKHKKGLN